MYNKATKITYLTYMTSFPLHRVVGNWDKSNPDTPLPTQDWVPLCLAPLQAQRQDSLFVSAQYQHVKPAPFLNCISTT